MKFITIILRVIVGLVFIISAIAKLYPIEPFEVVLVDLGVSNWLLVPFLSRTIIALELFLGISILFNQWGNNMLYYLAQTTLVVFTAYLIYLLITEGNNIDCGCFGSWLTLTPVVSILKNAVLFVFLLLIKKERYHKGLTWFFPLLFLLISFPTVFLLNKVGLQNIQAAQLNEPIDLEGLPSLYFSKQKVHFKKGKKVVIYLSTSCGHCKSLAYRLAQLTSKNPKNVLLVVASSKEENLQPFFDDTGLNLSFIWMSDDTFFKYSGGTLPAIIYIEEGVLKKKWSGEFVDLDELEGLFLY